MKRLSWLLFVGVLASCSSKNDGNNGHDQSDAGGPTGASDTGTSTGASDTGGSTGADASEPAAADAGTTGFRCPATIPGEGTACTSEEALCEYSAALTCPEGCSGGDYHSYQCSKGRWVDYRHSAGTPRCVCKALDFPYGMRGTWRFSQVDVAEPYAWIRFSALGTTLGDDGTPGQGAIEILAGPGTPTGNIPWWSCSGQGRWFITQTPLAFEVRPPTGCASASTSEIYTLTSRESAIPPSLPGCLLHITMDSIAGVHLEACKYPDTQCDAAMKTCRSQ